MGQSLSVGRNSVWVWSGETAIFLGSLVFVALFVPIVVWQYRRFGGLDARRLLGAAAASVYLTALVTYTWMPLPDGPYQCRVGGPQLEPFRFVDQIRVLVDRIGRSATLTSTTFLQVFFNVVLFVPWGIGVRRYLGRSIAFATLSGFAVSLLIETTQATALWGIYPCPYRLADVDDLITNTLGAFIGAVIAPLVLWWMPKASTLRGRRLEPRPVTVWRRWLSMLIEAGLLYILGFTVTVALRFGELALSRDLTPQVLATTENAGLVLAWLIVFAVPGMTGAGSLGLRAAWLVPVWPDGTRMLWLRGLLRSSIVSAPLVVGSFSPAVAVPAGVLVFAAVASVPFTRNRRGLTFALAGADLQDSR